MTGPSAAAAHVKQRRVSPLAVAVVVGVGALVLLCAALSLSGLGLKLLALSDTPLIAGQEGRLDAGDRVVIVAVDRVSYDLSMEAARNGDLAQSIALESAGRTFRVLWGTRIQVLYASARGYQVRILNGSEAGRTGWVPPGIVKR